MRRLATSTAGGTLTALGLVGLAPTTHAATVNVSVDCASDVSFSSEIGDTVVFQFDDSPACDFAGITRGTGIINTVGYNDDMQGYLPGFLSTTMQDIVGNGEASDRWYAYTYDQSTMTTVLNGETVGWNAVLADYEPASLTPNSVVSFVFLDDSSGDFAIRWLGAPSRTQTEGGAAVPPTRTIDFKTSGATCSTSSSLATSDGQWIKLPSADQCRNGGRTLLGWATSPDFPVPIAQTRAASSATAIDDTFNGIRMIFIPAGGYTYMSDDNTLYAIWSA